MKLLTILMLSAGILSPSLAFSTDIAANANTTSTTTKTTAKLSAPVKVTSVEGVTEYLLANGMRVLLFPDASKPTITTNIIYKVGSRHENYGETGMAHLLEHLLFKPSAKFGLKKGTKSPVEILNSTGAEFNGTTWYDRTNYYATFPAKAENLDLMLAMEADRMINAAIDQNDLWNPKTNKGEMTVVRNEFEIGESDPMGVTTERIQAVAYDWHNYGKSTIGARSDIEQVNIPRLRAFYKNYYQPDNAMLMVAGKFDADKILKQVNELFGRIPKPTRVISPTYTVEPTQDGERAVTVRRSGGTQYVGAGYHIAPSGHIDAVAHSVLDHILASAPSGRLHKALVETKLATQLVVNPVSNLEPGYRIYGAVVPKEVSLDQTQEALLKVLENLKTTPITEAELARAKQSLSKHIDQTLSDTTSLTIGLTEYMAAGDWRLFFLQRDQLAKLSLADVQAVAERYLKTTNRTLGRFIPTDTVDRTEVPHTPDVMAMVKNYQGRAVVEQGEAFDASPSNIETRTKRFTLNGGLKAAFLNKKTKGAMVSVSMNLHMGTESSLDSKAAIGSFTAMLLNKGTEQHSRQEIKDMFDKLGAVFTLAGNAESLTANITVKHANLAASVDLLAEILKKPAFAEKEFEEIQRVVVNGIEQAKPEPQPMAVNALTRLYDETAPSHVHHTATFDEQIAATKAVKLADIKAFHAAFYGADHANFSAVGDFDADALKTQLNNLFGNWKAQQSYVRIPKKIKTVAGTKLSLNTPDKANSFLFAMQPIYVNDSHADYAAILMANHMLGGGALRSRLADRIRQKEGLSYGVGSFFSASPLDNKAMWGAYAMSAPENGSKVEVALREEVQKALSEGFTEAELVDAKKGWKQTAEVQRTQDDGLAVKLASYLHLNRTLTYDQTLESKVSAITIAQVNEALRKHLKPENISLVIAADAAKATK
ncbi:MAG: insulinase family protein [Undibacterium sp.]|nr:insulinase family protein [Undibacterium sp.]